MTNDRMPSCPTDVPILLPHTSKYLLKQTVEQTSQYQSQLDLVIQLDAVPWIARARNVPVKHQPCISPLH